MGGISSMALAGCVLVTATTPSCGTGVEAPELVPGYGRLTVAFIPNAGQTDPSVNFQARALGGMAFFTQGGLTLTLPRSPSPEGAAEVSGWSDPLDDAEHRGGRLSSRQTAAVRLRYEGTSGDGFVSEGTRLPGVANFLIGNDPSRWKTDLPTYAGIAYEKMYPNIRIRYEGADGNLKSTIEVEPGGDPSRIRWTYDGVEDIILNHETGDLAVIVGSAERDGELGEDVLVEHAPIAWQVRDQQEIPVPVEFELDETGIIQFKLGAYDSTRPLIIDPTITYSTFVGSQTNSIGRSIDKDAAGNVYIAGETDAVRFPTTGGAKDTTANGGLDVFVTKLNSIGNIITYSTFLGGNQDDVAHAIAVDAATGELWLVGSTRSTSPAGWPTKSPAQGLRSGVVEGFVAKLNAAGSDFVFSSYHGGNGDDYVYGVAVDGSGNGYTTGSTTSTNLTVVGGAHDSSPNGGTDAFFTKWSSAGARQYSTYLGGTGNDTGYDVAVAGNVAYVVGETASSDFQPVTAAPGWDASHNGGTDAFLVKFSGASPVLENGYLPWAHAD